MLGRAKFIGLALRSILRETKLQTLAAVNNTNCVKSNTVTEVRPLPFFRNLSSSSQESNEDEEALKRLVQKVQIAAYKLLYLRLEDKDKRELSALFMQVIEGQCPAKDPKSTKKADVMYWEDWKKLGDMTKETAAKKYLEIAKKYF